MRRNPHRLWVILAIVDVAIATVSLPLSIYVGMHWGEVSCWVALPVLLLLNGVTYFLGWYVSWLIYKK